MARTLAQIQKQIDELTREAERMRKTEVAEVIERIKDAIKHYDLTAKDLGLSGRAQVTTPRKSRRVVKSAAKFKDPATGRTWSGRGRRPQWFVDAIAAGKTAADLAQ